MSLQLAVPVAAAAGLVLGAAAAAAGCTLRGRRLGQNRSRSQSTAFASWLESVTRLLRDGADRPWGPGVLTDHVRTLYPDHALVDPSEATRRAAEAVHEIVGALEAAQVYRRVVETGADVVVRLDALGNVLYASAGLTRTLGWPVEALRGRRFVGWVHAADLDAFTGVARSTPTQTPQAEQWQRARVRSREGDWHVLEWAACAGEVAGAGGTGDVVLVGRDLTRRLAIEAELVRQATQDELTGLPNRKAILSMTSAATTETAVSRAVVMVDLDRFKQINESLGHATGDELLAQVGPRLQRSLRPHDVIARLGGDDFAVVLPDAGIPEARLVAERLAQALEAPFLVAELELHVEASFGIAVSGGAGSAEPDSLAEPGGLTEDLMRQAEIALHRAKDTGSVIAVYDPETDGGQTRSRLALSAQLRNGIADGELIVYYQPVVDVLDGVLESVEALVRWQHPERGLVPPGEFLPLAEQSGLIVPMSKVVLRAAIAQAAQWAQGGRSLQVAVNMSPRWLQHGDVPDIVATTLEEFGVDPSRLRLEITESVVLVDPVGTLRTLNRLRDMGIGLALDDFGTGYSSMTHLRELPVDQLKVDKAFVQAMVTSPQDAVIVRAAVELAHNLGMDVIAEGIEDADTLAEVVASGCARAQGFYFARPMPASDLTAWADERFPLSGASVPAQGGPVEVLRTMLS